MFDFILVNYWTVLPLQVWSNKARTDGPLLRSMVNRPYPLISPDFSSRLIVRLSLVVHSEMF